jgi:ABC-type oligopeptide transport system substrate-binding subunit/predicted Ser/Thr protein kinase/tetratricopeptide (TPR) repeat protein
MIGTVFNERYRIDAELGRGGMGVVYRARDTLLERDVALKVMSSAELGAEGRARLLREAQATARLNHSNIVSAYDAGEVDGVPFIVMEFVAGETLHQRRPETLHETLVIARQVCAALDHAHEHGIIHRDLKPENIMLLPDGTVKLMDFGLARSVTSRLTTEGTFIGTVFYLPPEQAVGDPIDQRADLYALGVVLYELTTGGLPFTSDDPIAVITQHLHAPVIPPRAKNEQIPSSLDILIVQLLSKDPADRPASAAEVLRLLEAPDFLDEQAAPARELSLLERIERGRLVGREQELQEGRALWNQVLAGRGQVLLIGGEPGVGKTRLVRELITRAEVSGGQALVGASHAEGNAPYDPFRQIVYGLLCAADEAPDLPALVLADLLTLVPQLRSRYPDLPDNPPADPQEEQQRMHEHLLTFFTALSDRTPLLLVLEDSHWADSGTLSLLHYLSRHTRHHPILIVVTYRDVELDQARPLHEVLLDLERAQLATRLKLARLELAQTRELLAVLLSAEITDEFLEGIYRETEGNPFFVEEVCKALVESGKLTYENGEWHRPSIDQLGIPQSVRVAIQSRVGRLTPNAQEMLGLAAILGRTFEFDTLAAASEQDEDTLIDGLESSERAQLIEEISADGGGTFAFVHALIPSTLVDGLRTLQRRKLHRLAAAATEMHHPDDWEALAYHYSEAGDTTKAAAYLLKVGDQARSLYAHQEAIDSYRQALEILRDAGQLEQAAQTLMKLGLVYHNAFDFPASRDAYDEGFVLWQRAGEAMPPASLPPAPHPLRLLWNNPITLDPGECVDAFSSAIIEQVFSGLVRLGPEMTVVPDVAQSWEILEGGRSYCFHLRDNLRWSDETPLSAHDFEFAWKRVLNPAAASSQAPLLYDIQGARAYHQGDMTDPDSIAVRALDDLTLQVDLEGPVGYFLQLLPHETMFPVPRHTVLAHGAAWTQVENLVSNGPFRLLAWEHGRLMRFARNPVYHGHFAGNVMQVELIFPAGELDLPRMYKEDDLDLLNLTFSSQAEWSHTRQRYAGEYLITPTLWTFFFAFDTRRPPFDDPRVRRAFTLATDRERLANVLLRGYFSPATGGMVPPGMPGHSHGIGLPYEPEEARRLLAEAGYPEGRNFAALDVLGENIPLITQAYEYLRAQWRENLGVESSWEIVELEELDDRLYAGTTPPLYSANWIADYPDPDSFLRAGLEHQRTGWQNQVFDELVQSARRSTNQTERMSMYLNAERILIEEAPILPVAYCRFHSLVKPWLKKVLPPSGWGWSWKDAIIELH